MIVWAGDYTVLFWNLQARTQVVVMDCEGNSLVGLAVTKYNPEVVAGGWGGFIRLFTFKNADLTARFDSKAGCILTMALTDNNKLLIIETRDKIVKVLNYGTKLITSRLTHTRTG